MYAPLGLVCKQIWMSFFANSSTDGRIHRKKKIRKKMHQSQISYESAIFKILKSNEDKNFKINSHNYMYQRDTK